MTTMTNPIQREAWTSYFDAFSKRFLRDDVPEIATVDVRGRWTGERRAVTGARAPDESRSIIATR